MNETKLKNADIDGVLTQYFQAEMPKPWPAWQAPRPSSLLRSRWFSGTRLAAAASIAALLTAYLALAGFFPREVAGKMNNDPSRHIGLKSK